MEDLTADDLLSLHNIVEEKFKILPGVKDPGLVKAIAERPNQILYDGFVPFEDIFSKAASLMEGIIRMHPFFDGNKRTALLATMAYLELNGYTMVLPLSAVRFTVNIARCEKNDPEETRKLIQKIAKWIKKLSAKNNQEGKLFIKALLYFTIPIILLIPISVITLNRVGGFVIGRWMAFDMYPEYRKEGSEVFSFMLDTMKKGLEKSILKRRTKNPSE